MIHPEPVKTPSPPVFGSPEFVIASLRTQLEEKDDKIEELDGRIEGLEHELKNYERGYQTAVKNADFAEAMAEEFRTLIKAALTKK